MLYTKQKRSKWPFVVIAVIVILVATISFFACRGSQSTVSSQQTATQQTSSQQTNNNSSKNDQQQTQSSDPRELVSTSKNTKKPDSKVVYLTFDDGPSDNTHKILSILDQNGIKATWFVIGVSGHLSYIKDLWKDGMQIGLHTYSHDYGKVYASAPAFWKEIERIGAAVKKYLGFEPTLVRFPGGSYNGYDKAIAKTVIKEFPEKGYHYFDWNVSCGDAESVKPTPAAKLLKNVEKEAKGTHSCCVLMHDTDAKPTTVDALPQIIQYFKSKGYTFGILNADSYGYHF